MSALPDEAPQPTRVRPTGMLLPRRFAMVGVALAIVVLGLLAGPRFLIKPSIAAEVKEAMRHARSWHLVGWRLHEGKKVRWEIWGRRSPYFYREQLGNDIVIDDGTHRLRILAPDSKVHRDHGMILRMASHPIVDTAPAVVDSLPQYLEGIGGDYMNDLSEISRSGNQITLQTGVVDQGNIEQRGILYANLKTRLPERYELHQSAYQERSSNDPTNAENGPDSTQAVLDATFNGALPASVQALTPPADYTMVDVTAPFVGNDSVGETATVSQNGLTIQAKAAAQDKTGNVRLRFQGWLGTTPIDFDTLGIALSVAPRCRPFAGDRFPQDDQGRTYRYISAPLRQVGSYNAPELYFVPLEPIAPGAPRAKTLTIWIQASADRTEQLEGDQGVRKVSVVTEEMALTLPLPEQPIDLGFDTTPSSPEIQIHGSVPTIGYEAAMARAAAYKEQYYKPLATGVNIQPRPDPTLLDRSVYWYRIALRESQKISGSAPDQSSIQAEVTRLNQEKAKQH